MSWNNSVQVTEYIDFRQYLFAIKRRWRSAVAVFGFVFLVTGLYTFSQKPVYEAKGNILIKKIDSVTSPITQNNLQQIQQPSPVGKEADYLSTEAELIRSATIARKTITALNLKLKPEQFQKSLSVDNLEGTDILVVAYQSTEPQKAAEVVNTVMGFYLENNILANRTEAVAFRKFITEQLPTTKANLYQAEATLRKFQEENNVIDLAEEAKTAVGAISNLENQLSEARAKLAGTKNQAEAIRSKLDMNLQQAITANTLGQAPEVQSALTELQQVESQLAVERTRFQESHPTIVNLENKKASLKNLLKGRIKEVIGVRQQEQNGRLQKDELRQQIAADLARLEVESLGLASQVSALSNLLNTYRQRTDVLPKLKQQELALEREVAAAQATYTMLLKRIEEIRVEENRDMGDARITERAVIPEVPVAPKKARNLALGSLLGLLLAIGTALLLDALDTSIKSIKEVREVFGYTLLGLIPAIAMSEKTTVRGGNLEKSAAKLVVRDLPCSPISETYRILKANLGFLYSDRELKVVVVTSSAPKEGKSTVSANLAVAMAQSERRVLLVDADMRQPTQHKIWELFNEAGLSNVLVGQAELGTAIKEVMVDLHILTAGVTPPNPMNLLESKRMASLIERFANNYDFVIVDAPSLSIAADAPILGKMADGILLVVRPGVVDAASAAAAKEFLERSSQNVLGLVVNGVTSDNKPYSSYYAKEYYVEEGSTTRETVTSDTRNSSDPS